MKKIIIAIILLICMLTSSGIYINCLKNSVAEMNTAVSEAYVCIEYSYRDIPEKLNTIDHRLKKTETVLCAFIDQDLISDVKTELLISRELYIQNDKNGLKVSLIRLYKAIEALKATEEFNLKKIL